MIVRAVAVVVCASLAGGCLDCEDTTYFETDTFSMREDDPVHAVAIEGCFRNDYRCERLCLDVLPPPPPETIREVVECYANRDYVGGFVLTARSKLVRKCDDGWDDWGWGPTPYPDATTPDWFTDAWREQVDAQPPDASEAPRD